MYSFFNLESAIFSLSVDDVEGRSQLCEEILRLHPDSFNHAHGLMMTICIKNDAALLMTLLSKLSDIQFLTIIQHVNEGNKNLLNDVIEFRYHKSTTLLINRLNQIKQFKSVLNHLASKNIFPLHVACEKGNLSFIQHSLESLPNLGLEEFISKNKDGYTPLHVAAYHDRHQLFKISKRYFDNHFIDVMSEEDNEGNTPLSIAALRGNTNTLTTILSLSKYQLQLINNCNNEGNSALRLSLLTGRIDSAIILLKQIETLINLPAHPSLILLCERFPFFKSALRSYGCLEPNQTTHFKSLSTISEELVYHEEIQVKAHEFILTNFEIVLTDAVSRADDYTFSLLIWVASQIQLPQSPYYNLLSLYTQNGYIHSDCKKIMYLPTKVAGFILGHIKESFSKNKMAFANLPHSEAFIRFDNESPEATFGIIENILKDYPAAKIECIITQAAMLVKPQLSLEEIKEPIVNLFNSKKHHCAFVQPLSEKTIVASNYISRQHPFN